MNDDEDDDVGAYTYASGGNGEEHAGKKRKVVWRELSRYRI